jgi:hypothetical protein
MSLARASTPPPDRRAAFLAAVGGEESRLAEGPMRLFSELGREL